MSCMECPNCGWMGNLCNCPECGCTSLVWDEGHDHEICEEDLEEEEE